MELTTLLALIFGFVLFWTGLTGVAIIIAMWDEPDDESSTDQIG